MITSLPWVTDIQEYIEQQQQRMQYGEVVIQLKIHQGQICSTVFTAIPTHKDETVKKKYT